MSTTSPGPGQTTSRTFAATPSSDRRKGSLRRSCRSREHSHDCSRRGCSSAGRTSRHLHPCACQLAEHGHGRVSTTTRAHPSSGQQRRQQQRRQEQGRGSRCTDGSSSSSSASTSALAVKRSKLSLVRYAAAALLRLHSAAVRWRSTLALSAGAERWRSTLALSAGAVRCRCTLLALARVCAVAVDAGHMCWMKCVCGESSSALQQGECRLSNLAPAKREREASEPEGIHPHGPLAWQE